MASVLFKYGTQTAYDQLRVETPPDYGYDPNSLYFITDTNRLYKGAVLMSEQAIFTTSVPDFDSAKSERIYVVTTGDSVSLYVKGSTQMVQAGGGTVQPGAITDINVFNESVLTTSTDLSSGELPDSDTTIPTAGAVKDAIETAVATINQQLTQMDATLDGSIKNVAIGAATESPDTKFGLVFTKNDDTTITINLDKERYLQSAQVSEDGTKLELEVLIVDGTTTTIKIPLSELTKVDASTVQTTQSITVTTPVGNFTKGQVIDVTNIQDLLTQMLTKDSNPTTTQPSVTVLLSNAGAKEVGTEFTPTWSVTLNPGSYSANKGGAQPTNVTATSYSVTDTNSGSSTSQSGSFTQFTVGDNTTYRVSATVQHTAGAVPTTYLGTPYEAGQIQAGSKSGQSSTVTGYRKGFYGAVTSKDATINSAFVRGLASSTTSNPAQGNTWSISVPVGTLRVAFAYPATLRDVNSVKDVNGLNAEIKSAFTKATVSVEGANGYTGIEYKVYVTDFASATTEANTYTVQI